MAKGCLNCGKSCIRSSEYCSRTCYNRQWHYRRYGNPWQKRRKCKYCGGLFTQSPKGQHPGHPRDYCNKKCQTTSLRSSESHKAAVRKYHRSAKGKAAVKRYTVSEKGRNKKRKLARQFLSKPQNREKKRLRDRENYYKKPQREMNTWRRNVIKKFGYFPKGTLLEMLLILKEARPGYGKRGVYC